MTQFKVGDQVTLRPKTKPYTFKSFDGRFRLTQTGLNDSLIYKVERILYDGDIYISGNGIQESNISPHHLQHAIEPKVEIPSDIEQQELRLELFRINPNLRAWELQEIETWILNK